MERKFGVFTFGWVKMRNNSMVSLKKLFASMPQGAIGVGTGRCPCRVTLMVVKLPHSDLEALRCPYCCFGSIDPE